MHDSAAPINGDPYDCLIPEHRKERCAQCDPTGLSREATARWVSGQHTFRCRHCGTYLFCLPKKDSGTPQRSVKSRPDIDLAMRAEVLERDRSKCLLCGRTPEHGVVMHVSHVVSVDDCKRLGVPEPAWNEEFNLCTLCEECNLSQGNRSFHPVHLFARLIAARHVWVKHPMYRKRMGEEE